jgi:16S rRNA (cytidine1402-2'-O)-methyltransferase
MPRAIRRDLFPDRPLVPLAVCASPIGNLRDVTLRVLDELREADLVLCEDTRRTATLLDRHGIAAGGRLRSYHQHNEAARSAELIPLLESGARVALVSDAGLPGLNDPGGRLVSAALEHAIPVTVLPGPSAVQTALVASGLARAEYRFLGYLPRREAERARLWAELVRWPHPAVAFESPKRLPSSLGSLARALPARQVAVCRELTKLHEEVVRGTATEVAARFHEPPRGEVAIVLGAVDVPARADVDDVGAVRELVALGVPRRRAAGIVARLSGASSSDLYDASL